MSFPVKMNEKTTKEALCALHRVGYGTGNERNAQCWRVIRGVKRHTVSHTASAYHRKSVW